MLEKNSKCRRAAYVAPRVGVYGYRAERGYATSSTLEANDDAWLLDDHRIEVYTDHEDWTTGELFWE